MSRGEDGLCERDRGEAVIAVGTTRAPKLRAVERAISDVRKRIPEFLPGARLEARSVPSGVPETPTSREQAMEGARERARAARAKLVEEGRRPVLGIGLEGGLSVVAGFCFLESWAYVTDGRNGSFGSSGAIALPEELGEAVMARNESLGAAADRLFARREVAANEGTFGVLTRMMVSREEAFARALLHALAPFYNSLVYRPSSERRAFAKLRRVRRSPKGGGGGASEH